MANHPMEVVGSDDLNRIISGFVPQQNTVQTQCKTREMAYRALDSDSQMKPVKIFDMQLQVRSDPNVVNAFKWRKNDRTITLYVNKFNTRKVIATSLVVYGDNLYAGVTDVMRKHPRGYYYLCACRVPSSVTPIDIGDDSIDESIFGCHGDSQPLRYDTRSSHGLHNDLCHPPHHHGVTRSYTPVLSYNTHLLNCIEGLGYYFIIQFDGITPPSSNFVCDHITKSSQSFNLPIYPKLSVYFNGYNVLWRLNGLQISATQLGNTVVNAVPYTSEETCGDVSTIMSSSGYVDIMMNVDTKAYCVRSHHKFDTQLPVYSTDEVLDMTTASAVMICASSPCTIILLRRLLRLSIQLHSLDVYLSGNTVDLSDNGLLYRLPTSYCIDIRPTPRLYEHSLLADSTKISSCTRLTANGEHLLWLMDTLFDVNYIRFIVDITENHSLPGIDGVPMQQLMDPRCGNHTQQRMDLAYPYLSRKQQRRCVVMAPLLLIVETRDNKASNNDVSTDTAANTTTERVRRSYAFFIVNGAEVKAFGGAFSYHLPEWDSQVFHYVATASGVIMITTSSCTITFTSHQNFVDIVLHSSMHYSHFSYCASNNDGGDSSCAQLLLMIFGHSLYRMDSVYFAQRHDGSIMQRHDGSLMSLFVQSLVMQINKTIGTSILSGFVYHHNNGYVNLSTRSNPLVQLTAGTSATVLSVTFYKMDCIIGYSLPLKCALILVRQICPYCNCFVGIDNVSAVSYGGNISSLLMMTKNGESSCILSHRQGDVCSASIFVTEVECLNINFFGLSRSNEKKVFINWRSHHSVHHQLCRCVVRHEREDDCDTSAFDTCCVDVEYSDDINVFCVDKIQEEMEFIVTTDKTAESHYHVQTCRLVCLRRNKVNEESSAMDSSLAYWSQFVSYMEAFNGDTVTSWGTSSGETSYVDYFSISRENGELVSCSIMSKEHEEHNACVRCVVVLIKYGESTVCSVDTQHPLHREIAIQIGFFMLIVRLIAIPTVNHSPLHSSLRKQTVCHDTTANVHRSSCNSKIYREVLLKSDTTRRAVLNQLYGALTRFLSCTEGHVEEGKRGACSWEEEWGEYICKEGSILQVSLQRVALTLSVGCWFVTSCVSTWKDVVSHICKTSYDGGYDDSAVDSAMNTMTYTTNRMLCDGSCNDVKTYIGAKSHDLSCDHFLCYGLSDFLEILCNRMDMPMRRFIMNHMKFVLGKRHSHTLSTDSDKSFGNVLLVLHLAFTYGRLYSRSTSQRCVFSAASNSKVLLQRARILVGNNISSAFYGTTLPYWRVRKLLQALACWFTTICNTTIVMLNYGEHIAASIGYVSVLHVLLLTLFMFILYDRNNRFDFTRIDRRGVSHNFEFRDRICRNGSIRYVELFVRTRIRLLYERVYGGISTEMTTSSSFTK